jgi:hypothetical protein
MRLKIIVPVLISGWLGTGGVAALAAEKVAKPLSSDVAIDQSFTSSDMAKPDAVTAPEFLRRLDAFLDAPTVTQDIDPKAFRNFWRQWQLVTTRYKPDGAELRFVYANKIAAAALATGTYPFPDGAALAKIGARAVHDPLFDSSLIPGSIGRVQVMLRKPNDPNARDGWVYSLFTSEYRGHLTSAEINACQACHELAKSRDSVFSQPFPGVFGAAANQTDAAALFADKFKPVAVDHLSQFLRETMQQEAPAVKSVMLLEMPAFIGSMFEAREIVARLAREKQSPYVFSAPAGNIFIIDIPTDQDCIQSIHTVGKPQPTGLRIQKENVCAP